MNESGKHDLKHFLSLAAAQLRHRLKGAEASEAYSERINRLRLLEELIKEQVPQYDKRETDSRHSTGTVG